MQLDQGKLCPLLNKECVKLECSWFTKLQGGNPQTGQPIDEWSCAVAWLPILLIENTKASNEVGAAVESFRNETLAPKLVKLRPLPERIKDGG